MDRSACVQWIVLMLNNIQIVQLMKHLSKSLPVDKNSIGLESCENGMIYTVRALTASLSST